MAAIRQAIGIARQSAQHRPHVDRIFWQALAGIQPRQGQQVLHHLGHAQRLAAHFQQQSTPFRDVFGVQHVEIAVQHSQRRAQLVRHIGHKVLAHLFELQQFADIARHQQIQLRGVFEQTHAQTTAIALRRRQIDQWLGRTAFKPRMHPWRTHQIEKTHADILPRLQTEQAHGGFVEPLNSQIATVQHQHRIG
ncbi:MAG: hypothetical protein BWZ07_02801 [Alphaproteobacteria bacterium ADurb.BinA280]|nr:MAG: hypothetical protein BWZ07_02801 [Alphaproteobacteria bacterium ADurb.BinA280]